MTDYINDIEKGDIVEQMPTYIKNSFIRRVYFLLSLQLLLTGSVSAISLSYPTYFLWIRNPEINLVCMFFTLPLLCALPAWKHKFPWNIILLFGFTLSMSIMVAYIVSTINDNGIVIQSLLITTIIFISLTLVTFQTKYDFSFLGMWLFVCISSIVLFSLLNLIFMSQMLHLVMSWVSVVVFSGYILYDTSNLIHQYGPDDAIEACINIYLDIINLFISLLSILSNRDS
jgi:FtsH-binding integral membrane protein